MDFDLTEDQRAFQATARQFAREAMVPTHNYRLPLRG